MQSLTGSPAAKDTENKIYTKLVEKYFQKIHFIYKKNYQKSAKARC